MLNITVDEYLSSKYIAFIDVLGFSNIVNSIITNNQFNINFFDQIQGYYNRIVSEILTEQTKNILNITYISDSLIITSEQLEALLWFLFNFQSNMILRDFDGYRFLVKGYVTQGHFIHNTMQNVIFGEAYQRAFEQEEKIKFPQIILDPDIRIDDNNPIRAILTNDNTSVALFINYARRINFGSQIFSRVSVEDFSQNEINKFKNNLSIQQKYQWLLHYFQTERKQTLTDLERKYLLLLTETFDSPLKEWQEDLL